MIFLASPLGGVGRTLCRSLPFVFAVLLMMILPASLKAYSPSTPSFITSDTEKGNTDRPLPDLAKRAISGKVTNEDRDPLVGATVLVKGTSIGTITSEDGTYRINAPDDAETLIFSYVGYGTHEIRINQRTVINVILVDSIALDEVVVVGSRGLPRTDVTRPVPVDIVDQEELAATGQLELGQMVQFTSPSFNSAKYGVNGTTNYAEPATLRGLSPDQALVLINGKRRHQFSALQLNVAPGLGTVVTDINSIPAAAVERMEVLRDGAAAQYGSDAIAGIINFNLKRSASEGTFQTTAGIYREGDGFTLNNSLNHGFGLGKEGSYLNVTLNYFQFAGTNRSDPYTGAVYSNDAAVEDSLRATRGVYPETPFVVGNYGSNQNDTYQSFVNAGYPLSDRWKVYAFGGTSRKDIVAYGFFRNPARFSRAVPEVFPDGYVPVLPGRSIDLSGVVGITRTVADEWNLDLSYGRGHNHLTLEASNTTNPSLGVATPTSFRVGKYLFDQDIVEANLFRYLPNYGGLQALNVAFGAQFRQDRFQLERGSLASYQVGPLATEGKDIGSSGRPGIAGLDENDLSRTNVGVYADVEADISENFLLATALRYENYSDFGGNLSGKLASRLKLSEQFALRGSVNRGFRAPSLGQIGNRVNTSTVQNDLIVITTQVSSDDPRLAQLGVEDPQAETSWNYSLGATLQAAGGALLLTLDGFLIDISDRIVISERLDANAYPAIAQLFPNVREIRFFTNHIDTRTRGLDFVATYQTVVGAQGSLNANVAFTINETEVVRQKNTPEPILAGAAPEDQDVQLLGEVATQLIEVAQPRNKTLFSADYQTGRWGFILRATRFGSVTARDNVIGDQVFRAKTLSDVAVSYDLTDALNLTLGSNNVFDVYPDKWKNFGDGDAEQAASYSNGQIPYPRNANQFGFSGAYHYLRAVLTL